RSDGPSPAGTTTRSGCPTRRAPTSGVSSSWSIVLAEVFRHVLAGHPAQRPPRGPLARVGARILDCDIVTQRVEIRARQPLDEVKLAGVRQAAVAEPEPLVEVLRVEHERVGLPLSHGAPEVQRVVGVAFDLPFLLASVRIDEAPVPVAAA